MDNEEQKSGIKTMDNGRGGDSNDVADGNILAAKRSRHDNPMEGTENEKIKVPQIEDSDNAQPQAVEDEEEEEEKSKSIVAEEEEPIPSSSRTGDQTNRSLSKKNTGESSGTSDTSPLFKQTAKSKIAKRNYRSRTNEMGIDDSSSSSSSSSSANSSSSSSASSTKEADSNTSSDEDESFQMRISARSTGRHKRSRIRRDPDERLIASMSAGLFHPDGDDVAADDDDEDDVDNLDDDLESNGNLEDDEEGFIMDFSPSGRSTPDTDSTRVNIDFLSNAKPDYRFCAPRDIIYRQSGIATTMSRHRLRYGQLHSPGRFQDHIYGCRFAVEKLELMYKLKGHDGCVNSLNFNKSGQLLVSGSDDLKIKLWKWASNEMVYQFESTHLTNVFQTKFMDIGGGSSMHIISSSRDGYVKHHELPSSGGPPVPTVLIKHILPVHKIALPETSPFDVLTAGEDGYVVRCDLRDNHFERLVTVKDNSGRIALYSIASHPLKNEFCVCGRDQYLWVYDRRNIKNAMKSFCPAPLMNKGSSRHVSYITSAVYNYLGDEILASYSDNDIFLFDTNNSTPGAFLNRYQGHQNSCTIKGVNFFGPKSEFVMSGSDCGNCFFWDKQNASIVQWMAGDERGSVNVMESHPAFPIVATSGIDNDVKIWVPSSEEVPTLDGLKKCVQLNIDGRNGIPGDMMESEIISFFMRHCMRPANRNATTAENQESRAHSPNVNDWVSSDSSEDDFESTNEKLRALPCAPS